MSRLKGIPRLFEDNVSDLFVIQGRGKRREGGGGGSFDALCIPRNARKSFEDPPPLHLPAYLSVSPSPRERVRSKNSRGFSCRLPLKGEPPLGRKKMFHLAGIPML